jgi:hypothetical protein
MDIFMFKNPTNETKMEQGEIINNIKSKMWIERYDVAGEFELVADASTGIREKLPIGSFISHIDTEEIMIVENHEIVDQKDRNSEIKITGRGFETYFENRIIGSNNVFPIVGGPTDYVLAATYPWIQATYLIKQHAVYGQTLDDNNAIMYMQANSDILDVGESVERSLKRENLYDGVSKLISSLGLGIKIIRPKGSTEDVNVMIHKGVDRSNEIVFSYDTGEIESAEYLWSNKKDKNAALISGRWVETVLLPTETNYKRRWVHISANDIDGHYDSPGPTGGDLTVVIAAMQQRAREVLDSMNQVALTKAEVSRDVTRAGYKTDFDVGDIISVFGDYNETTKMRITEYVEIEDETGQKGYPTLSALIEGV